MDFENDGGHSVLLMKAGSLPTLNDADFTFRSKELVKGDQVTQPIPTLLLYLKILTFPHA